jgi:hypothetical protein
MWVCIDAAEAVTAALYRAHLQLQLQLVFFLKPLSCSASTYGTQLKNLWFSMRLARHFGTIKKLLWVLVTAPLC